ncbi:lysostaphin resistance A-like protein [Dactylosporangium sp. CA-092794]|uniref:CPBP family intramembrane glutamic endopeptidase n=1 Tax=Dactylosporangium sp. CA-092794 TaxID=3239929 RepID=UPI003D93E648
MNVARSGVEVTPAWRRMGWGRAVALHLLPAAVAFAAALAFAPLTVRLGLPAGFALPVAFAVVLTPLELGLLLRAAHAVTGRWSVRAFPAVLAYRRPIGRWWWSVPVLFAVALLIAVVWAPVGAAAARPMSGVLPGWMLPGVDDAAGVARPVLVATLLVSLVVDGLVNPAVEELYFRGFLLPRLPLAGWGGVPVSAALFAVQHYWQPYNWPLIFVLQLILTSLVVRLRCLRLGVVMHVLANSFGIVVSLIGVLA